MPYARQNPLGVPWITYGDVMRALESGELPGHEPIKDWEDATKLNIEVNEYGWQGQHALIRLHLPKDNEFQNARMAALYMAFDFKHTKPWLCEFCGEPARETHMQFVPYVSLQVCRMPVFIHHVCDMDKRSCQAALRAAHDRLNEQHGSLMGPHASHPPKAPGEVYPLAGSCATCQTDESARPADMKRCSACKMTRYCSHNCQREDWPRHKTACKRVKLAEFEGFAA